MSRDGIISSFVAYIGNGRALRMAIAALASVAMLVPLVLTALVMPAYADEGGSADAAPIAASTYTPDDTVSVRLVSDGTHSGPGTECFINSKNGYAVGDNDANDGVVCSDDTVSYAYQVSFLPGPKRTVTVQFGQNGKGDKLYYADFGQACTSSSVVSAKWDGAKATCTYSVPRGAVATLTGNASVRAKDTAGVNVADNGVIATLRNGEYKNTSTAEPVTVVSAPLADLTIDAVSTPRPSRYYTQSAQGNGAFNLEPYALKMDGYSSAGATASGQWHTDIDVSDFPAGTTWTFDGKPLTVQDGKLKDLRGTGSKPLQYTLPAGAYPTKDGEGAKSYSLHLLPYDDSFQAGDQKNVKDPGTDEPSSFNTANTTVNGASVHALQGVNYPNNNWGSATFAYEPEPPEDIWRYDVYAPRDRNKTIFEDGNRYWYDGYSWDAQGGNLHYTDADFRSVTMDNDMYSKITINANAITDGTNASQVVAGDTWNYLDQSDDDNYQSAYYDSRNKVVVKVGGQVLDPSKYTVQWRTVPKGSANDANNLNDTVKGASAWVESDYPPADLVGPSERDKAIQYRVLFNDNAFVTGNGGQTVTIQAPLKARNDYDTANDNGKLLNSSGTVDILGKPASEGVTSGSWGQWEYTEPLAFPVDPTIRANIQADGSPVLAADREGNQQSYYTTNWVLNDTVASPTKADGNTVETTLTFARGPKGGMVFDVSSFKLTSGSGWTVENIDTANGIVTLKNTAVTLTQGYDSNRQYTWLVGQVKFSVNTIPNISSGVDADGKDEIITGTVHEHSKLTAPDVASFQPAKPSESDSSASQSMDSINGVSAMIQSNRRKAEIGDDLSFTATLNAGHLSDGTDWSQVIVLPRKGDSELMKQVATNNGQDIQCDTKTNTDAKGIYDGYCGSDYTGDYTLHSLKFDTFKPGTKVYYTTSGKVDLSEKNEQPTDVVWHELTIGTDGTVQGDIPAGITGLKVEGTGNISDTQSAGFKMTYELTPTGNKKGDVYLSWMGDPDTPAQTDDPTTADKDEAHITPWPDQAEIVSSNVEGIVWNDADADGVVDDGEERYSGVTVQLQRKKGDGWEKVDETTTNKNGAYRFENLHSTVTDNDRYVWRTALVKVERAADSDEVAAIDGKTDGKDGTLEASITNRFNVAKQTTQTFSYPDSYGKDSAADAAVTIPMDATVKNVNYGFRGNKVDLKLDKGKSTVSDNGDGTATVNWDVTVKNNGQNAIRNARLSDRMSASAVGVQATLDYQKLIPGHKITGAIGRNPGYWIEGSLVYGADGAWVVKSYSNYGATLNIVKDASGNALTGISGAIGEAPYDYSKGSLVYGADGVWLVKPDGSTLEVKGADGNMLRGVSGATGYSPLTVSGSLVFNADGVWMVRGDGSAVEVKDADGNALEGVSGATGDQPGTFVYGSLVYGADGAWLVNEDGLATAVSDGGVPLRDISGATGSEPGRSSGSLVYGADGVWLVRSDGSTLAVKDADGNTLRGVSGATGEAPGTSSSGSLVYGADGAWLVDQNGFATVVKRGSDPLKNISGATGNAPLYSSEDRGPLMYGTDGVWLVDKMGRTYSVGMATAEDGTRYSIFADRYETIASQSITPTSTLAETDTKAKPNTDWVRRTYTLPDLQPGKTVTIHFTATVVKTKVQQILGNQAWISSADDIDGAKIVDRGGITAYEGKKDGKDLVPTTSDASATADSAAWGVPGFPKLPAKGPDDKDTDYDADGIVGTTDGKNTVGLNRNGIDGADTPIGRNGDPVDDLADQTPAAIPAGDTTYNGAISGTAWYDNGYKDCTLDGSGHTSCTLDPAVTDSDSLRNNGVGGTAVKPTAGAEMRADGITVQVVSQKLGKVVGETVTDRNGRWTIKNLDPGDSYEVHYGILGWKHDGRTWSAVDANVKKGDDGNPIDDPDDSDVLADGYVVRNVVAKEVTDAAPYGADGNADAGLRIVDASIQLIKGGNKMTADTDTGDKDDDTIHGTKRLQKDTPTATDQVAPTGCGAPTTMGRVDDGDGDPRTHAYATCITNNGNLPLTNIALSDETLQGNAAVIGSTFLYYPDGATPDTDPTHSYQIRDGHIAQVVTDASGKEISVTPVTLQPGGKLAGTVHVVFTNRGDAGSAATKDTHADRMTVTAGVVVGQDPDGSPTIGDEVTDKDRLTTRYEFKNPLDLTVKKVSATDHDQALQGAVMAVNSCKTLSDLPAEDVAGQCGSEVGTFTTGKNGTFSVPSLDAGVYRITEKTAPSGFAKPDGAWYVRVSYGDDAKPSVEAVAIGDGMPAIFVPSTGSGDEGDTDWGTVRIENQPLISALPLSGGDLRRIQMLTLPLALVLTMLAGAIYHEWRRRKPVQLL